MKFIKFSGFISFRTIMQYGFVTIIFGFIGLLWIVRVVFFKKIIIINNQEREEKENRRKLFLLNIFRLYAS